MFQDLMRWLRPITQPILAPTLQISYLRYKSIIHSFDKTDLWKLLLVIVIKSQSFIDIVFNHYDLWEVFEYVGDFL